MSFKNIYRVDISGKVVLMFEIPAAPRGVPVSFKGYLYGRNGESIGALSQEEIRRIFSQTAPDWSAAIVDEATLDDLDPEAIAIAKKMYINKYPEKEEIIKEWDDITFLNKAKLTQKGKITRTTLLLVGNEEASYYLSPAAPYIHWILRDTNGLTLDHELCTTPFIVSIDTVYKKIRNITYQYMKEGTLIPEEVKQNDPFIIREALYNCIAHSEYTLGKRIDVIESEDNLTFVNGGRFLPSSVESVVIQNAPENMYRNQFLVNAMINLKMVETAGGGIRKMFEIQRRKGFPLPDYKLSEKQVEVVIIGRVVDETFADILMKNTNLRIEDVILLDKVSKGKSISKDDALHLKKLHLVEGRYPNIILSKEISTTVGKKVEYSKQKGLENEGYRQLLIQSIKTHGGLTRKEIEKLLVNILPTCLSSSQKKNRIDYLLRSLRKSGLIVYEENADKSVWRST